MNQRTHLGSRNDAQGGREPINQDAPPAQCCCQLRTVCLRGFDRWSSEEARYMILHDPLHAMQFRAAALSQVRGLCPAQRSSWSDRD